MSQAQIVLSKPAEHPPFQRRCTNNAAEVTASFPDLCGNCRVMIEASIDLAHLQVWEELPFIFGLPSWETLKAQADEETECETSNENLLSE